jgi:hypothetical protein
MYVGLYSQRGCSFNLKVIFPKEDLRDKAGNKDAQTAQAKKLL